MAEILRVIQSIPHEELVGRIESNKLRFVVQFSRNVLMEQRTDFERARRALSEKSHQTAERAARVHYVLDEQDVLPFKSCLGIVKKAHEATGLHRLAVTRRHEEVYLKWPPDVANEIAQEDEASLQQSKDEQIAVRICLRDLFSQLGDAGGNRLFVVSDPPERAAG